jgi:hypothetical protein
VEDPVLLPGSILGAMESAFLVGYAMRVHENDVLMEVRQPAIVIKSPREVGMP